MAVRECLGAAARLSIRSGPAPVRCFDFSARSVHKERIPRRPRRLAGRPGAQQPVASTTNAQSRHAEIACLGRCERAFQSNATSSRARHLTPSRTRTGTRRKYPLVKEATERDPHRRCVETVAPLLLSSAADAQSSIRRPGARSIARQRIWQQHFDNEIYGRGGGGGDPNRFHAVRERERERPMRPGGEVSCRPNRVGGPAGGVGGSVLIKRPQTFICHR